MLRSMYAGISGMKNSQIKLDTIGNNIANVNTFGFKKGRTTFSDMVSQELSGATAPVAGGRGGINAAQVGLGMQLASIDTIHTQGSLQNTSRALDLGISGDGYFVVNDGESDYYTRAGNFYLDAEGNLVNSSGLKLQSSAGEDINFLAIANGGDMPADLEEALNNIKSFSIGADGSINIIDSEGNLVPTEVQIGLAKFANAEGLAKAGDNLFVTTPNSGPAPAELSTPGAGGTGSLVAGTLEMSNVDLSEEFTEMIVAQRGFQANTRIITTSDDILQELINLKR
ncbi:flagellar basal body rod protein FlgG [Alkalihalobacillus pseudalcaliphilus]|uniref:flagellar basal body rod protein FlgG n=1 Tax=Alkalihalobacillus pseudalcaliphilus TaxID=79884 RepID=UPI00064DAC12|nr:flagellar basal body rod protein FlgG [Alkalihalobacillus pseudalcaliphilus]KMK77222.1 flagellar basal body rod protein FlgG [Alkalihalobacillus pseudalcaliphilus]